MTCQKTLFRVDVVSETVANDLEHRGVYRFASPTADRVLRPNSSQGYVDEFQPPATPIWTPPSSDEMVLEDRQHHRTLEKRPRGRPRLAVQQPPPATVTATNEHFEMPSFETCTTEQERVLLDELFRDLQEQPLSPPPEVVDPTTSPPPPVTAADPPVPQMFVVTADERHPQQQNVVTLFVQHQPKETKDAWTSTEDGGGDEEKEYCSCCLLPRKTTGLGIAKKRLLPPSPESPAKRRKSEEEDDSSDSSEDEEDGPESVRNDPSDEMPENTDEVPEQPLAASEELTEDEAAIASLSQYSLDDYMDWDQFL